MAEKQPQQRPGPGSVRRGRLGPPGQRRAECLGKPHQDSPHPVFTLGQGDAIGPDHTPDLCRAEVRTSLSGRISATAVIPGPKRRRNTRGLTGPQSRHAHAATVTPRPTALSPLGALDLFFTDHHRFRSPEGTARESGRDCAVHERTGGATEPTRVQFTLSRLPLIAGKEKAIALGQTSWFSIRQIRSSVHIPAGISGGPVYLYDRIRPAGWTQNKSMRDVRRGGNARAHGRRTGHEPPAGTTAPAVRRESGRYRSRRGSPDGRRPSPGGWRRAP
jgi:hypothetical protein